MARKNPHLNLSFFFAACGGEEEEKSEGGT
jgi:hypothetical protein